MISRAVQNFNFGENFPAKIFAEICVVNDPLPHLSLFAENHAVRRFDLTLFLERELGIALIKDLQTALVAEHGAKWRFNEFVINAVSFTGEISLHAASTEVKASAGTAGPEGYGLYAVEAESGQPWQIRLTNIPQHAAPAAFAAVLSSEKYDRWQAMYRRAAPLIQTLLAAGGESRPPVKALGVAYADWFYWNHPDAPAVNQLLNESSDWIPQRLSASNGECQFHLSSRTDPDDPEKSRIDFLNFSVAQRENLYSIELVHNLTWELHPPQAARQLAPHLDRLYQAAHDENKKMFSNVLHPNVIKKLPDFQPVS
mgnify:CR=1 FL=1